jgi:hypothetical protein
MPLAEAEGPGLPLRRRADPRPAVLSRKLVGSLALRPVMTQRPDRSLLCRLRAEILEQCADAVRLLVVYPVSGVHDMQDPRRLAQTRAAVG